MPAKDQFSEREIQILAYSFQCLKDPNAMQVDYDKLAGAAGFQSLGGARNAFAAIKKKLMDGVKIGNIAPATPKKNTNKGVKAAADNEDDENNNEETLNDGEIADNEKTPGITSNTKKGKGSRKPKAKATPIKAEEDDAEPSVSTNTNDNGYEVNDENNAEDSTITEVTPVKPKRKYTRKPKDPNAPPTKRAKKNTKKQDTPIDDAEEASGDNNEEAINTSVFGDGKAVKAEGEEGADDFIAQTASQEQLAAENALVPDAA